MNRITKRFDRYSIDYATRNPEGRDLTRIQFFDHTTRVGQLLSGSAIAPGSFVYLQNDEILLYFDSSRISTVLALLQNQPHLALYFVPDDDTDRDFEHGVEGGICNAD
jgi:hypothetical protein